MNRLRLIFILAACSVMHGGCQKGGPPARNDPATPAAVAVLDTEERAREFGARFANEQLQGKTFPDASNDLRVAPPLTAKTWRVAERAEDRWTLVCDPPAEWTFKVSVNVDGSAPKLEEAYFAAE